MMNVYNDGILLSPASSSLLILCHSQTSLHLYCSTGLAQHFNLTDERLGRFGECYVAEDAFSADDSKNFILDPIGLQPSRSCC
jgi:hypothetical protein